MHRSEHDDRDPLPVEPVLGEDRVGAGDEVGRGVLPAPEVVRVCVRGVDLLLEVGDSAVEAVPLGVVDEAATGDPDPDQDPDHEHQEHRRERGDVVAEVEHGCSA